MVLCTGCHQPIAGPVVGVPIGGGSFVGYHEYCHSGVQMAAPSTPLGQVYMDNPRPVSQIARSVSDALRTIEDPTTKMGREAKIRALAYTHGLIAALTPEEYDRLPKRTITRFRRIHRKIYRTNPAPLVAAAAAPVAAKSARTTLRETRGAVREAKALRRELRRKNTTPKPLTKAQRAYVRRQMAMWLEGQPQLRGRRATAARAQLLAIAYQKARAGRRRAARKLPGEQVPPVSKAVKRGARASTKRAGRHRPNPSAANTTANSIRVQDAYVEEIKYRTADTGEGFKHRFKKGRLKVRPGKLEIVPAVVQPRGISS